jgi:hypothetical protein
VRSAAGIRWRRNLQVRAAHRRQDVLVVLHDRARPIEDDASLLRVHLDLIADGIELDVEPRHLLQVVQHLPRPPVAIALLENLSLVDAVQKVREICSRE